MERKAKRKERKFFLWSSLKQYLLNSSIHGFKYLVEPDRHWTERLFWIIACGVSCWACGVMVISTIQFATARDVSITMATDYLGYEAQVPALHFCMEATDKAKEFMYSRGLDAKNIMDYQSLGLKSKNIPTEEELAEIIRLTQPTCENMLAQCLWNDEEINCCDLFFPLQTNSGLCLSANSLQSIKPGNTTGLELFINHRKQKGRLTILIKKTKEKLPYAYLMNRYEYPTAEISTDRKLELKKKSLVVIDVTAVPTVNKPEVIDMPMSMRKCRMSSENADNLYLKWYNYDGCLMEQQMRNMLKLYGCISHIFPRVPTIEMCNATQLDGAYLWAKGIKNVDAAKCLPDCEGIVYDFSLNKYEYPNLPTWAPLQIEVNMLPGPSIQYERYATRSLLQVIISVGSVVGLFMGASLLSIVELLYWLIIRTNP
ncbi:uncharacterized protein LOC114841351 [Diachasma alloeum]|uniref:uncharacterized protein LOC114841351 n=1 Tax=Diachasma alloeum TaxID=454923 RepID=UPI0010FB2D9F|nr:uncharacterized protein LOC114841351 [Diachasma alloeum]